MILWSWLCEKISYLTTLLWYFIDHPSCHLHVNFLGICTRLQARLYTEEIQVNLGIFHDIVLKSFTSVLYFKRASNANRLKQSSEEPIYHTDVGI